METVQVKAGTNVARMLKLVGCRKRKMFVSIVQSGERETSPGWWDGGSREEQVRVELWRRESPTNFLHDRLMVHSAPQITNPFAFNREEGFPKVNIHEEQALLSVGTFCGKPRTPHLLCTQEFWEALQ